MAVVANGSAEDEAKMDEWNEKSMAFHEKGDNAKAIECVTEAIKLKPDKLFLYGNRSLYYLMSHQFEMALKDAEIWTANNPTERRHFFRLGASLIGLERYAEADALYRKAAELDPENKEIIWGNRNKWFKIISELKDAEKKNHTSESRGILTVSNSGNGSAGLDNSNGTKYYLELNDNAIAFHEAGKNDKAIECMNEAIRLKPDDRFLYGNRSLYYLLSHQFEMALRDAEIWTGNNPTERRHFFRLGASLIGLERYEEADALYKKAAELDPENKKIIRGNRNKWLKVTGELKDADKKQSSFGNQGILAVFSDFFSPTSNSDEGTANMEDRTLPKHSEWNDKGIQFHNAGKYDKAIGCMNEAIRSKPDELFLYGNRSLYYLLSHQFEMALKDAEIWTANNPTEKRHFLRLGASLMGLERYEEADALYSKAVELYPEDKEIIWENRNKWLEIVHERSSTSKDAEKKQSASENRGIFAIFADLFSLRTSLSEGHEEMLEDTPLTGTNAL